VYELITNETIYNCIAAPNPEDIKFIMTTILSTPDLTSCLSTVNAIKQSKGLALADILTGLADELNNLEINTQTRVTWLEGLAEIEYRLAGGGSEGIQTAGMVGVLRTGCDLVGGKGLGIVER
jgi:replication factor C subunit 3/5